MESNPLAVKTDTESIGWVISEIIKIDLISASHWIINSTVLMDHRQHYMPELGLTMQGHHCDCCNRRSAISQENDPLQNLKASLRIAIRKRSAARVTLFYQRKVKK